MIQVKKMISVFRVTAFGSIFLILGYVAYFDYMRSHSIKFRKKIYNNAKKERKIAKLMDIKKQQQKTEQIKNLLENDSKVNPIPNNVHDLENFFMLQILMAEQQLLQPDSHIDAGLSFYRALSVYPNVNDIMNVFKESIPKDIYDVLALMVSIKPPKAISGFVPSNLFQKKISTTSN